MTTYVLVNETAYTLNNDSEISEAQQALREAGLKEAAVYAGEPDGSGDSYANGQKLFAE